MIDLCDKVGGASYYVFTSDTPVVGEWVISEKDHATSPLTGLDLILKCSVLTLVWVVKVTGNKALLTDQFVPVPTTGHVSWLL